MRIEHLARYGIPTSILASWKRHFGSDLLPVQTEAVQQYGLLNHSNLLISSPTSSGKTFCAEIAAIAELFQGGKVIYLVPLKAIAEEKYSDFCDKYAALGIKLLISTKDHPESDPELDCGNFDLAFVVYEKFNQLLIRNPGILARLALVVVDEIQLLLDPSRGPVLERALAKIRLRGNHIQIVALSSALNQSRDVADWLRCTLLHKTHRPVELHQGVLWQGTFRYRKYNSLAEGAEDLPWLEHSNPQEILFMNLQNLLEQGDQILVFLKSKKQVENAALLLSEQLKSQPTDITRSELLELEPTCAQRRLLVTLQSGIAFHNADMTFEERKLIEKQYLAGEIRIVFCTSTLSLGVNLPAKTVFIEPMKFQTLDVNNSSVLLPLDWWEYENMAGRAGRLGQQEFGRAIYIANSEFEAESLWETYIETKSKATHRNPIPADLEASILDLISAFGPVGLDGMREFLSKGLFSGKEFSIDAIHGAATG